MSEGFDSVPSRFSLTVFVEYGASFASDFDLADSKFFAEKKLIFLLWGT
jgi:hypothetical protein